MLSEHHSMALSFEPCVGMENMNAEPKKFLIARKSHSGSEVSKARIA